MQKELAYIRTIKSTLEKYIKEIPYMSNSLLTEVIGMNNLNTFTDLGSGLWCTQALAHRPHLGGARSQGIAAASLHLLGRRG